jgi:hypothetical protein
MRPLKCLRCDKYFPADMSRCPHCGRIQERFYGKSIPQLLGLAVRLKGGRKTATASLVVMKKNETIKDTDIRAGHSLRASKLGL